LESVAGACKNRGKQDQHQQALLLKTVWGDAAHRRRGGEKGGVLRKR